MFWSIFNTLPNNNVNVDWYTNLFNPAQVWCEILNNNLSIKDRRFSNPLWQDNGIYQYIANSYMFMCSQALENVKNLEIKDNEKSKYTFFLKQYLEAVSPSNFIFSNPQAIQAIIDSKGQSIVDGMVNYLEDMQKGRISQSKDGAFVIGENVACTSGDVIKKTPLYELIRYHNSNIKYKNPILIIPPCINKYYILDLQPHNSLVKFLTDSGFDVYLMSWRNIKVEDNLNFSWDDYVAAVQECILNIQQVHVMGFCIGGTIASCAIADLDKKHAKQVASLSLLTTLLDFEESGILGQMMDETQFNYKKHSYNKNDVMTGQELGCIFNSLRPQELVWKYVNENYLQGKQPASFDILHWNNDSTNLPANMYCWYIENTYIKNNLIKKQAVINNKPLDLNNINTPIYAVGCEEDHIVPWAGALKSIHHLSQTNQDINFILSSSGHIAGIINPINNSKRYYYKYENISDSHISPSEKIQGSWWSNWLEWLESKSKINKTSKSENHYQALYPAPGEYVKS